MTKHLESFDEIIRRRIPLPSQADVMANWPARRPPEVSVICPTHNHADLIERALIGFLIQRTNFPFEVLVRDDGSTDGTAEIVQRYSELYPDILRNLSEPSDTWGKVRHNDVLVLASLAPLIAPCDGDDFWIDDEKVQKQRDFLVAHPTYSLVYHGTLEFSPDGRVIGETIVAEPKNGGGRHNGSRGFRAAWSTVMFRKAPLMPINFPPAVVPQSDVLITHRIAQLGNVRAIPASPWTARMRRFESTGGLSRGSDYQTAISRFVLSEMLLGEQKPAPEEAVHFFGEGMRRLLVIAHRNGLPVAKTFAILSLTIIEFAIYSLKERIRPRLGTKAGGSPNGS